MEKTIKTNDILENVSIIDISSDGKSVAKLNDFVFFVEDAVPGDLVDIKIYRKKKNFGEAKAIKYHILSPLRVETFCSHFGICGGCKWQNLTYQAQLDYKQKQVTDTLERLGKLTLPKINPILGSEETVYYRNKLEFTFSNKKWITNKESITNDDISTQNALGFHVPKRFDKIIDIQECYLQSDLSNEIRNTLRHFALEKGFTFYDLKQHSGFLRNLIIRTTTLGETMVIVVFAELHKEYIDKTMEFLSKAFPKLTSLLYIINQKRNDTIYDQDIHIFSGQDCIYEEMNDLNGEKIRFRISPKSFYQTNSKQAEKLYKIAANYAEFTGTELVYDLYTGAGTIANFIARSTKKVVGIDVVEDAIRDAVINSELNKINNTVFYAGDMKTLFNEDFIQQHGKPDVIITDPPRAGMHEDVCKQLIQLKAPKIVYISCNPATQARDIALLEDDYEVVIVQPIDMFPHTQHVENIILMRLKKNS